jgi:protein-S-isoprenylcysteine O-methyltransferase Ste14
MTATQDTAGVIAPPPLIYVIPLAAGILLNRYVPQLVLPHGWARILGPVVTCLGLIALPAALAFRRARTDPRPWRPTTALVITGPYKYSRNPMYVGFTCCYIGVALWVNALWPLLALPAVIALMNWGVISREEAYLERIFGEPYRAYRNQVRRWL